MKKTVKSVKISGIDYKIIECETVDRDSPTWVGCIRYPEQEIRISESLADQRKKIILIHEILHGMLNQLNFKEQDNEHFIDCMALSLYQLIKDNPELIKAFSS